MPIFDAHLHYSRESWTAYPPEKISALMDSVGVRSALVSSAPDEGTFRLKAVMGDRIIPMLGPYRNGADVFSWARDGTVVAYVQSAYRPGMHRGFGEFHLNVGQTALPVVKSVLAFAAQKNLFLQPHADARAVAELLGVVGADRVVLWAHAGVTATPDEIDALLAKWPHLWTELSLRDDIAPQGKLDPKWRALLLKYGDRFMVGTDTWTVGGSYTATPARCISRAPIRSRCSHPITRSTPATRPSTSSRASLSLLLATRPSPRATLPIRASLARARTST
ncbi:MAG: amidohydrolase [Chloroflexi bacterium]|nr:MAG: amidohydrolase [Chloroflexota bacterium]